MDELGLHYSMQVLAADKPIGMCLQLAAYDLNIENVFNQ